MGDRSAGKELLRTILLAALGGILGFLCAGRGPLGGVLFAAGSAILPEIDLGQAPRWKVISWTLAGLVPWIASGQLGLVERIQLPGLKLLGTSGLILLLPVLFRVAAVDGLRSRASMAKLAAAFLAALAALVLGETLTPEFMAQGVALALGLDLATAHAAGAAPRPQSLAPLWARAMLYMGVATAAVKVAGLAGASSQLTTMIAVPFFVCVFELEGPRLLPWRRLLVASGVGVVCLLALHERGGLLFFAGAAWLRHGAPWRTGSLFLRGALGGAGVFLLATLGAVAAPIPDPFSWIAFAVPVWLGLEAAAFASGVAGPCDPAHPELVEGSGSPRLAIAALVAILVTSAWLGFFERHAPGMRDLPDGRHVWDTGRGLEIEMVYVPPGDFIMGDDGFRDRPRHTHPMPQGYYIGKTDTTRGQFRRFVAASGYRTEPETTCGDFGWWRGIGWLRPQPSWRSFSGFEQTDEHPVVLVSWDDAKAFCDWASLSLPTEAQWEKAARGADGREYPWGNEEPTAERCVFDDDARRGGTLAVGSCPRGASPCGALDMAGNVWQLCLDRYDRDAYARYARGDTTPRNGGQDRVIRGGGWHHEPMNLGCARRFKQGPEVRGYDIGFRPARVIAGDGSPP